MKANVYLFLVILVNYCKNCQSKRYDNYTLYNITPLNLDHLKFLQNLEKQKYIDMVFFKRPYKLYQDVHFIVNPADRELFLERAKHFNVTLEILLFDIQSKFDEQKIKRYTPTKVETYTWDSFHKLEDIYQWLSDLVLKFPSTIELYTIGRSVESREILAIRIDRGRAKEKAMVEGGIHGNEWISTEYVNYLAYQLISCNESSGLIYSLAKQYVWFVIPVLNPDGYDYSQKVDRLWKKNRRSVGGSVGVNLNRNFDYSFRKFATSDDPRDDEYCGPQPFSETETKALHDFVKQNHENLLYYFGVHSYGQNIIIPYSDRINHVENYVEIENYGKQAISKMYKLYKTKYSVGTFYDTMGSRVSGNSASWVKKNYKVKYALTFFLRDNGSYGYALPNNQILPTCQEMLAGMTELMTVKQKRMRMNLFGSGSSLKLTNWLLLCWMIVLL